MRLSLYHSNELTQTQNTFWLLLSPIVQSHRERQRGNKRESFTLHPAPKIPLPLAIEELGHNHDVLSRKTCVFQFHIPGMLGGPWSSLRSVLLRVSVSLQLHFDGC